MRVKEESEKAGCNSTWRKTNIMVYDSITSWQIKKEKVKAVTDFIFLGSKINANGDCSYEIKWHLLFGRKGITKLDSVLKSRHYIADKAHIDKALFFPIVVYPCESWSMKKAEGQRTDDFELWSGEDSWESLE